MLILSVMMFIIGFSSILFLCDGILNVLISLEFMILSIFILFYFTYYNENILELLMFLVFMVGESVLGLILLTLKINFTSSDNILMLNVY
uniref:NADH dehydrogenase subunit 4L n=2 Tax=Amblyseiinae TaxID=425251 RepID=D5HKW1_PHYPM|nr:NADH dehydrogenase subunit 4L [Phytoseiulus persimilis]